MNRFSCQILSKNKVPFRQFTANNLSSVTLISPIVPDSELEVFLSKYGIERLKFEISNFKFNSYETDSLVNKYLFENENFHSSNLIKNTQESITAMNN